MTEGKVMKAIGLDIGTTTICGVILDGESGEVLFSRTLPNDSQMESKHGFEKLQDPEKIWSRICQILHEMAQEHPDADSIGLTGQMHGILYVDAQGKAVSPLYTWQDESGNCVCQNDKTYAEILTEQTGYFAASGFGMTTYYYHQKNGLVPEQAAYLCTIGDYIAMQLTRNCVPVITPSNAASLGLFDLEKGEFDRTAVAETGLDFAMLPEVVKGTAQVGRVINQNVKTEESLETSGLLTEVPMAYAELPVSAALGDNQASAIGTVKEPEKTVLVNVGTGSQISVGSKQYVADSEVELRPLTEDDYIFVGACLCGGRAYAALEKFFRQVVEMAAKSAVGEAGCLTEEMAAQKEEGMSGRADGGNSVQSARRTSRLYTQMSSLLSSTEAEKENRVQVNPQFCGTRKNPELRGSITNISLDNLTPQALIRGFLYGIAEELYTMYQGICPHLVEKPMYLVGSGNGIRMNPVLQKIFEELFEMKLRIPVHTEEAAYGTALFSLVAAGKKASLREAQELIRYEQKDDNQA